MPPEALLESAVERPSPRPRTVAKVLLADSDLASRLTLKSILGEAGYAVEGAATAAEAISRLDETQFQLVLADLRRESDGAGPSLLSYARQKEYKPATALINSAMSELEPGARWATADRREVRISNDDVSSLLGSVAELISLRADRRMRRASQI